MTLTENKINVDEALRADLAKKGVVARQLDGRAWLYEPARSRLDLHVATVNEALDGLTDEERSEVLRRVVSEAPLVAAVGDA